MREIDRRLAASPNYAQSVRVMTGAYRLTFLRVAKERIDAIFEGASILHEKVAYDQAIDEGRVRTSHRPLLSHGSKLFGAPNVRIGAKLTAIDDPERLERMLDAILDVKSWKELLAVK